MTVPSQIDKTRLSDILGRYLARIVGLSFVGNVLMLALPLYTLQIYDRVLQSGSSATLIVLTLIVVPLTLGHGILDFAIRRAGAGTAAAIDRLTSPTMLEHDVRTGDAIGRRNLDTIVSLLDGNRFGHLLDLAWAPMFLLVLALIHPLLSLVAMVGIALLIVTAWRAERAHHGHDKVANASQEALRRFWGRSVLQRDTWIAHKAQDVMVARMAELAPQALMGRLAGSRIDQLGFTRARTIRMLLQVALMACGAGLAIAGVISAGAIFAASLMTSRAVTPVENILSSWRSVGETWTALKWLMQASEPPDNAEQRAPAPLRLASPAVLRLRGVTYGPSGGTSVLFRDINCDLAPASVLTVIGAVGAGKSTLVRLMAGIEPPQAGQIIHPSADSAIGYAPQQPHLFPGTVAQNIALFRPHTAETVEAAIREAGVERIIKEIPGNVGHMISEVPVLSGGQQQAICLARAFFGRPALMVFDEPTARLDVPAEMDFARALAAARRRGAAIIVVTHSERILRLADQLLVLYAGATHELFDRPEQVAARMAAGRSAPAVPADAAVTGR